MKALIVVVALVAAACSSSTTPPDGVVVGGIDPCSGLPPTLVELPRYAAGTVTVYAGPVRQSAQGSPVFPAATVAQAKVERNATYRFVLPAGRYVLVADFPPPANVRPFTQVTVTAGETVRADIPNMCR